jgi:hypothetical protein
MNRTSLACSLLALALAAGPAAAQNPYYPNPYYPPVWGPGAAALGPGNTLQGGASVIQASGQLYINQEQARVEREKAEQAKLQTKKMAFDLAAYERENTPTFVEEQEKTLSMKIRRIMSQPLPAEVTRGDTLNLLLPMIKVYSDQGVPGPPQPLNPAMLKAINVTVGGGGPSATEGKSVGGAGVLRNGGKLAWPLQLKGPNQQKLDKLLPQALAQAAAGTLEQPLYTQVASTVLTMQDELRKQYHQEKIDGGSFLKGKHFLDDLAQSLKVLQDPNAVKFLDGSYAARGNTVPEVVANMTAQGLQFAPATPGGESAYFALHNAFVAYARAAQSGMGSFHSQYTPTPPKAFKGFN